MWSNEFSRQLYSSGMQRFTLFSLAILMACLSVLTLPATPVQAQSPTAFRDGDTITYQGDTYEKLPAVPDDPNFRAGPDTPACTTIRDKLRNGQALTGDEESQRSTCSPVCANTTTIYAHFEREGDGSDSPITGAHIICLQNDDPATRATANFAWFPDASSDSATGPVTFGAPDDKRSLTIGAEGENSGNTDDSEITTSCDSTYTRGLGWVICPLTNFLAAGMDWLFNVIKNFLIVQPITTNRDAPLYRIWGFMRNVANMLFVVGFLIIIYSQLTSFGLSNYGIKRLLPRLIMAAVLVNISYWITALAVDLSNAIGVGLQNMFMTMSRSAVVAGSEPAIIDIEISWLAIAGIALSGAALVNGIVVAGLGASIMLLLPTLLGVILSALVAVLVLAGRQALITVLIILSPLAFVAYLLPNTEKYFDKWRSIFMTMLLVFPLFSLVFGGSQLAGTAIIHNAGSQVSEQSLVIVILGLAVQVIPLAITPFLISISGSILGRLSGFVNNPNKGLVDKTRKFAEKDAAERTARRLATGKGLGARIARGMDKRNRRKEAMTEAYKNQTVADYLDSKQGREAYRSEQIASQRKTLSEKRTSEHFEKLKDSDANLRALDIEVRTYTDAAERAAKRSSNIYEDVKAASDADSIRQITGIRSPEQDVALQSIVHHAQRAKAVSEEMQSETYRVDGAKRALEEDTNELLAADLDNPDVVSGLTTEQITRARELQELAGNEVVDKYGPTRVKNIAEQKESQARETRVTAGVSTLNRREAKREESVSVALGTEPASGRFKNMVEDPEGRAAAIRWVGDGTNAPREDLHTLMETLDITEEANGDEVAMTMRSELGGVLKKNKPLYVSNSILNGIVEGTLDSGYKGEAGRERMIFELLRDKGIWRPRVRRLPDHHH
jgi:hypothetical protein